MADDDRTYEKIIVGLGVTGVSCVRFFSRLSGSLAVADTRSGPPGLDTLTNDYPGIRFYPGPLDPHLLCDADELVVSPGIPVSDPAIRAAIEAGVSVVGDIEVFCRHVSAPVIAVTGSNGKSTVATLVAEMAVAAGRETRLGGNIGTPALDLIGISEPDLYVLELSSFQLETTASLNSAASVILNISEDHMDRYAGLESYVSAKKKIYSGSGSMVLNLDDKVASDVPVDGRTTISYTLAAPAGNTIGLAADGGQEFICLADRKLIAVDEVALKGRHNLSNAMAALALGLSIGLPEAAMVETLKRFTGLPHRCQLVATINNVRWINDSKGTNVGACCAAIDGLAGSENLVLIAGGEGKGADFSRLADSARGRLRAAILIGKDAGLLGRALQGTTSISYAVNMPAAVGLAAEISKPGDTVLLSPACASFDMFDDYRHRGQVFSDAVMGLGQS